VKNWTWFALLATVIGGVHESASGTPAGVPPLETQLVASGFVVPVYATAPAGDTERIFVVEKNTGRVRIVRDGVIKNKPFLSLFEKIIGGSERGLLGLAFHPDYDQNGYCYVHYTATNGDVVVERYTVSAGDPDVADGKSGLELIREVQPFLQHKAGMLQFGPDGYLYLALGDGGSGYDPFNNAQSLGNLKGKILRIDVDGGTPYAIPPGNPFVSTPGARPEIYAYGLRNPWRWSIDSATGDIYIGDVGQEQREELDFLPAGGGGANFGWRCFEGELCTGIPGCPCHAAAFSQPFYTYNHDVGCAVVGGFVYRGCKIPGLQGTYFYADYCQGTIHSLRYSGGVITEHVDRTAELAPGGILDIGSISSFGLDGEGELLILDSGGGELFRIQPKLPHGPDCNSNGIADGCEIANGTALDSDGDGLLDGCEGELAISPLVPGTTATFAFTGAAAGEPVYFLVGAGGPGADPTAGICISPILCVGLAWPFDVLVSLTADPQGAAGFPVFVPPSAPLGTLHFQAVLVRGPAGADSIVSNVVAAAIGP
jgi:glucose/arabinose dehydrogenase